MNVNHIKGDIIDIALSYNAKNIAHNCNCFHTMGAGVAKRLNEYTGNRLLTEDKTSTHGDINKLGTYTMISYNGMKFFNLYGMFAYRTLLKSHNPKNVFVHWKSLQTALLNAIMDVYGDFIIPIMGCDLAGGHTDDFVNMIGEVITEIDNGRRTLFIVEK